MGEVYRARDNKPLLKFRYYLSPGWLEIDPTFDLLRKNPRFQKPSLAGSRSRPTGQPEAPPNRAANPRKGSNWELCGEPLLSATYEGNCADEPSDSG